MKIIQNVRLIDNVEGVKKIRIAYISLEKMPAILIQKFANYAMMTMVARIH